MARVIMVNDEPIQRRVWPVFIKIAIIGAVVGILYWLSTYILNRFIKTPYLAGNIATIASIAFGTIFLAWLSFKKAPLISIASGLTLWGLGEWLNGLSGVEKFSWMLLFYCLAYLLFWLISTSKRAIVSLLLSILIIIALRVMLSY